MWACQWTSNQLTTGGQMGLRHTCDSQIMFQLDLIEIHKKKHKHVRLTEMIYMSLSSFK